MPIKTGVGAEVRYPQTLRGRIAPMGPEAYKQANCVYSSGTAQDGLSFDGPPPFIIRYLDPYLELHETEYLLLTRLPTLLIIEVNWVLSCIVRSN